MPDAPFSLSVSQEGDHATVLTLSGPLVISGMFELQNALRQASSKLVVVDLTQVPYMDSSGMGALLNGYVHAEKDGRKLVVAGVNDRVGALFQLTKVDSLLHRYPDAKSAVASN